MISLRVFFHVERERPRRPELRLAHAHEWAPCHTPPDLVSSWHRCKGCLAFGYRRRGRGPIYAYGCGVKDCKSDAVDRVPGRGPRGSFLWRCAEHLALVSA